MNNVILRLWREPTDDLDTIFRAEFEDVDGKTLFIDLPSETWGRMLDCFAQFTYESDSNYQEHRFDLFEQEEE